MKTTQIKERVALIPVREGSERVKSKNFKPFYQDRSLTDIKIAQLKNSEIFDKIYISSDSERVSEIAEAQDIEFIHRHSNMCQAHTPWSDVVCHIMDTIPGNPQVTWALTTAPLFSRFDQAIREFDNLNGKHDSLVGVLPKKSFFINKHGRGINFNPGPWHPYSQQLETYFEVTGSIYIGMKEDMLKWQYWFGTKPHLFEVNNSEGIDVDTPDDFSIAQKLYEVCNENPNS